MDIGLLKTLTLLILTRQTVNPILILELIILTCLLSNKSVANPVADSDYERDADIKNNVVVPDIQADSTNEQESDGSKLILEKKVGNSLLDLLPVKILKKVFFHSPAMSAGYSATLLQQFLNWKDSNKEPQNFHLEYISLTLQIYQSQDQTTRHTLTSNV